MIVFHTIRYKNILSFGNMMTEIQLDRSPTTLIQGKNGGGKSTLLDAICYALFGKPFRKINRPQLINHKNKRELLTEIEFSVKDVRYTVRRGMNPQVFEIYRDGELINQNAATRDYQEYLETNILNFDYSAFTQIVILGKATYVSFMRLTTDQRRKFIESILGLNIFSAMVEVHRVKIADLKEKLNEIKGAISVAKEKIDLRENYIHKLEADVIAKRTDLIAKIDANIESIEKEINDIEQKINELELSRRPVESSEIDNLETRIKQLSGLIAKSEVRYNQMLKDVKFFTDNDICPTCSQPIENDIKQIKISELEGKMKEISGIIDDLREKSLEATSALREINSAVEANHQIGKQLSALIASKEEKNRQISSLISEKNKENDGDREKIDLEKKALDALRDTYEKLVDKKSDLLEKLEYFDLISSMLKDTGIKRMVIRKYIPLINKITNDHLKNLGFFVKFTLDEDFNEKILARGIDELSYFNFSEGEKLRIDLAILMTWREIAKMQNKMSTNLLIFDEIFDSSMDQAGVDAFVELLGSIKNTNVFVISHTPDKLADKFRSSISFEKENGFSKIAAA
jgi:DNA repair exonuclease SbcCD ATPase subunit